MTLQSLTDEASWDVLEETRPDMAQTIKTLVTRGQKPKQIARAVRRAGGTALLASLAESAAAHLAATEPGSSE